jgi:hypothetical protein
MFKVGKLYICEEYFLLLYPDPETAAAARTSWLAAGTLAPGERGAIIEHSAAGQSTYWSRKLGKSVLYAKKNIPILVLNSKDKFYEVLAGDRKGWIIYQDWLGIKEIEY